MFKGSIGIHFALSVLNRYGLPEILDLTGHAAKSFSTFNFRRVWINDNLEYRNILVALAALVSKYDLQIGTAVAVPHVRNPIDLASGISTLSELRPGRKIGLGLGAGSASLTGQKIELSDRLKVTEEIARFLRELLDGRESDIEQYPALSSYFHFKKNSFKLRFPPRAKVDLQYGFSGLGTKTTTMIAKLFDGIILQTRLLAITEMEEMMTKLEEAREHEKPNEKLVKVLMLNASVARVHDSAIEGGKRFASQIVASSPPTLLNRRNIAQPEYLALREKFSKNEGLGAAAEVTSDALVNKVLVAGTPNEVLEKISSLFKFCEQFGYEEVMIGPPLGPNPAEVIDIWTKDILPSVL